MRLKKRVEELEEITKVLDKQIERYEDERHYILDFLNCSKGYDCRCVDPLPKYKTIVNAVCETIEEIVDKQKLLDEEQQLIVKAHDKLNSQGQQNYDEIIKSLQERVDKQEETIKALVELCKPLLEQRVNTVLGEITTALEKELKDLFGAKTTKSRKKCAKSSAEKCKKCGESAKTTKKTSKKENK